MANGFKTGGRVKGSVNKSTRDVTTRLADLNCDPIEGMARIALNEQNPPELRGRMFAELAQYVAPKRKAVEHSGVNGEPLQRRNITIRFVEPDGSRWEPGQNHTKLVGNTESE